MYHLPNGLTNLQLKASKQGRMKPFTRKITWHWPLEIFSLRGFDIDSDTLKSLNLNESYLEKIPISGDNVKQLCAEWFPISVQTLDLRNMKIQEFSGSFEEFKYLHILFLEGNPLQNVNPTKFPISLEHLDVRN